MPLAIRLAIWAILCRLTVASLITEMGKDLAANKIGKDLAKIVTEIIDEEMKMRIYEVKLIYSENVTKLDKVKDRALFELRVDWRQTQLNDEHFPTELAISNHTRCGIHVALLQPWEFERVLTWVNLTFTCINPFKDFKCS